MPDIKRYLSKISESKLKSKTSNSIYYHLTNGIIRLSDHYSNSNDYAINIVIINKDVCVIKSSLIEIHCYYAEAYDYLRSLICLYPHLNDIKEAIKGKNDLINLRNQKINLLTQKIKNINEQYHNKDFEELLNEAIADTEKYKKEAKETENKCKKELNETENKCKKELNENRKVLNDYRQKVITIHDNVYALISTEMSKLTKIQSACKDLMKSYT